MEIPADLKIRVIHGATHAYACIQTSTISMDIRLERRQAPVASLQEYAIALRKEAEAKVDRANLILAAAQKLEQEQQSNSTRNSRPRAEAFHNLEQASA